MAQVFETSDPELAHEFLTQAYAENFMSVHGVSDDVRMRHSRRETESFYHDVYVNSMDVSFATQPLGNMLIAQVVDGQFERRSAGTSERFTTGDVFLVAEPHLPYGCGSPGVHLELIGIELGALAGVTGDPRLAEPGRLKMTRYQPVTQDAARLWHRTIDFVTQIMLPDENAADSPLLVASAGNLLAATALTVFPNTTADEPTIEDRHDAHPATLRRAVAFIDENAHLGISMADIATACSVTGRAVQLAFERHLGITPTEYLRRVRLSRAHQDLKQAVPGDGQTVTAIAYRWGFTSSSRFAAAYRQAYGVTPSHTLRQG